MERNKWRQRNDPGCGIREIAGLVAFLAVVAVGILSRPGICEEKTVESVTGSNGNIPRHETLAPQDARPGVLPTETGSEIADEELQEWLHRAGGDTPGTLAEVMKQPDGEKRRQLLEWILAAWTSEDRAPALAWLKSSLPVMPEEPAGEALDLLVGGWALENALDAMVWVTENLTEPWRQAALKDVASSWAQADPDAMGKWIRSQPNPATYWTAELIQGLIPSRPGQAMEWCSRIGDSAVAAATRQNVIQSWMLSDPAGAEAWLKDHPEMVVEIQPEEPPPP